MTLLKTALDVIETLLTDNTSEQAQAAAAGARIKLVHAMAQQAPLSGGTVAGLPEQIVRFMGKAYKVVPDTLDVFSPCENCAFNHDENHGHASEGWDAEGDVAPTTDCIRGRHYYVEV